MAPAGRCREPGAGLWSSVSSVTGCPLLLRRLFARYAQLVAAYTRLDVDTSAGLPEPPALIVVNHGFGGLFDLNVFAMADTLRRLAVTPEQPLTFLTHQAPWALGIGWMVQPLGCVPAGEQGLRTAIGRGEHVIVFPGGDIDAGKPWSRRHAVTFAGRSGFARLARDEGIPIVPMVFVGAGESALVLHDGAELARALRLDRSPLRTKALPVSVTLPWGLTVGAVGPLLPYLPLPTRIRGAVLPAMSALEGEAPSAYARRVERVMNRTARELATGRRPVLG